MELSLNVARRGWTGCWALFLCSLTEKAKAPPDRCGVVDGFVLRCVCIIGRMDWGTGNHYDQVWVAVEWNCGFGGVGGK